MPPLSDILPRITQCQIFSSLTRDVDSVANLLADDSKRLIVLAPSNAALHALEQKPWRLASDEKQFGTQAYEGEVGAQRANNNLKKFVERQVVLLDAAEWRAGGRIKTVYGKQVWWEQSGDGKLLQPGNIVVDSVEKAGNGEVWVIKGVLGDG